MKERILISIVSYRAEEHLLKCLQSLSWAYDNPNIRISIYDNSEVSALENIAIKELEKNFRYTKSDKNIGFGGGHNRNLELNPDFEPQFILVLNPDIVLKKEHVQGLLDVLSENGENIALVAPKLENEGEVENSILIAPNLINVWIALMKDLLGIQTSKKKLPENTIDVAGVSGALMLIRAEIIKNVGFFDKDFFMYYEDNDFCTRIIRSGKKILYVPSVVVQHSLNRSSEHMSDRIRWQRERMIFSSMLYFKKNRSGFEAVLLKKMWLFTIFVRRLINKDREWAVKIRPSIAEFNIRK